MTPNSCIRIVAMAFAAVWLVGCAKSGDSTVPMNVGAGEQVAVRGGQWYQPVEADFRVEYERDAANRDRQSWDGYWRYIQSFYEGNIFVAGWTKHVKPVLDMIRSDRVRAELLAALNELGRRIAAEWAKDNAVRAITTADLRSFGERLLSARDREDGSGAVVRAEIEAVQSEVNARLTRRGS